MHGFVGFLCIFHLLVPEKVLNRRNLNNRLKLQSWWWEWGQEKCREQTLTSLLQSSLKRKELFSEYFCRDRPIITLEGQGYLKKKLLAPLASQINYVMFSPRKASSGKRGFVWIPWGVNIKLSSHGYWHFSYTSVLPAVSCGTAPLSCVLCWVSCAEQLR